MGRARGGAAVAKAVLPIEHSRDVKGRPVSAGASKYRPGHGGTAEISVTIRVSVKPDRGVDAGPQVQTVESQTQNEFMRHWDNRFHLKGRAGQREAAAGSSWSLPTARPM